MHICAISAASPASIKDSTKRVGRPKVARPSLWRRPKAASFIEALMETISLLMAE